MPGSAANTSPSNPSRALSTAAAVSFPGQKCVSSSVSAFASAAH